MAKIASGDPDDALDIVQDAMLKLVEKYADKPQDQWRFLFFKILQSRITDWHRRNKVRSVILRWVGSSSSGENKNDVEEFASTREADQPEHRFEAAIQIEALKDGLSKLPLRQQQAFLLRLWEGFSVRQTAKAMACSEGSVKTHYSRAVHTLREQLEQLK